MGLKEGTVSSAVSDPAEGISPFRQVHIWVFAWAKVVRPDCGMNLQITSPLLQSQISSIR
jgi:hypothetical protein